MTMKKVMKIVIALLVATLLVITLSQVVLADTTDPLTQDLDTLFSGKDSSGASTAAGNIIGSIINIAQVIGAGVAIIMLIVLAIKYIAASPEGKGEVKKSMPIYIVGAIILFAASAILGIIRSFATNNISSNISA